MKENRRKERERFGRFQVKEEAKRRSKREKEETQPREKCTGDD